MGPGAPASGWTMGFSRWQAVALVPACALAVSASGDVAPHAKVENLGRNLVVLERSGGDELRFEDPGDRAREPELALLEPRRSLWMVQGAGARGGSSFEVFLLEIGPEARHSERRRIGAFRTLGTRHPLGLELTDNRLGMLDLKVVRGIPTLVVAEPAPIRK